MSTRALEALATSVSGGSLKNGKASATVLIVT